METDLDVVYSFQKEFVAEFGETEHLRVPAGSQRDQHHAARIDHVVDEDHLPVRVKIHPDAFIFRQYRFPYFSKGICFSFQGLTRVFRGICSGCDEGGRYPSKRRWCHSSTSTRPWNPDQCPSNREVLREERA